MRAARSASPASLPPHGVTTAIDAGTTGFINFDEFRRHSIERSRIRVLAFLNVAAAGNPTPMAGELVDLRMARPHETAETVLAYPDLLLGVKVRIGLMSDEYGSAALECALEASEACKLRLMVHISKTAPTAEVLNRMRPAIFSPTVTRGGAMALYPRAASFRKPRRHVTAA